MQIKLKRFTQTYSLRIEYLFYINFSHINCLVIFIIFSNNHVKIIKL